VTRRRREALYPLGVVVALLVAWQLWVSVGGVKEYVWPPLPDVLSELFSSSELLTGAGHTLVLIAAGFGLATLLGLLLAALTITIRAFEVGMLPLVISSQFVPLVAFAPLFVVWWGFGIVPKLAIVTLFGYFPVLITALTGLRSVETEKLYLVATMGAGRIRTFWRVQLPSALPSLFAGLRIAITSCVIGAVIAEFIVGSDGLGYLILQAQGTGDAVVLVAGVIYLGVIGAVTFGLVALAERLGLPWETARRAATHPAHDEDE